MKKNLFFTFCFSLIPGAGQMYQNYMKRGISIMLTMTAFIALSIMTRTEIFMFPVPIIVFYSFFDTFHIRNEECGEDKYIWDSLLKGSETIRWNFKNFHALVGIGLVVLGIYIMANGIINRFANYYNVRWLSDVSYFISSIFPALLISLASIIVGIKIITSKIGGRRDGE